MEDFNLKQFEPYLFLLTGLGVVIYALFKSNRSTNLKYTGEKVEGIVYELGQAPNSKSDFESTSPVMDKVTVRFVTKKKEWITSDLKQPFALFFTGQYKPGDKLDVYYDPGNPSNFYVDSKQSENAVRILFAVVGLTFCLIGLYKLFV